MTREVSRARAIRTAATRLLPAMVTYNQRQVTPFTDEFIARHTVDQAVALIEELELRGFNWEDDE